MCERERERDEDLIWISLRATTWVCICRQYHMCVYLSSVSHQIYDVQHFVWRCIHTYIRIHIHRYICIYIYKYQSLTHLTKQTLAYIHPNSHCTKTHIHTHITHDQGKTCPRMILCIYFCCTAIKKNMTLLPVFLSSVIVKCFLKFLDLAHTLSPSVPPLCSESPLECLCTRARMSIIFMFSCVSVCT